jgi:hypothetical protein
VKHAASLEEITQAGTTTGAVNTLLCRALRKLRRDGLICTAAELACELESHRNTSNSVYRRNGRRAGAK